MNLLKPIFALTVTSIILTSCSNSGSTQKEENAPEISYAQKCEQVKLALIGSNKYKEVFDYENGCAFFYTEDEKFGFVNAEGKEVVPAKYTSVAGFAGGIAVVETGDKKEIIDTTGKTILDLTGKYNGVWLMGDDRLLMAENKQGKKGLIDAGNNIVLPFEYDGFDIFDGGIIRAMKGETSGFIDKTGKVLIDFKYTAMNSFAIPGNRGYIVSEPKTFKTYLLDASGKMIKELDAESIMNPSGGIIVVAKTTEKEGTLYGALNYNGDLIVPYGKYYMIERADDETGLAAVGIYLGVADDGYNKMKIGYIDSTGKEAIPLQFEDSFSPFSSGRAAVQIKGKKGYIDPTGKLVIPAIYKVARTFSNGYALVEDTLGYAFPIDINGKEFSPPILQ